MKHIHFFASFLLAVSVATFSTQSLASTSPLQAPARAEATNSHMNSSPIKLGQNKPKQTLNQIV